jgi:hypothetical protein
MPNEELFSGIPALDDTQGLESYMNNATLESMGLGQDVSIPAALQPTEASTETTPAETPAPAVPMYTAEQVQQMIAQATAGTAAQTYGAQQQQQPQPQVQPQAQHQEQATYTPRQAAIIKELIDRGVPMSRIQAALNGNAAATQQSNIAQRLSEVEAYLQQQKYAAEQNAFIDKMTTFGNKFGLSENDLVTFGNKAMSMGINLTTVTDVEAVFRAVYPDQYAIRSQRIAASSAPIYGGSSTPEAPRAAANKMEDAYVDQFLKRSMPNQYGMFTK